MCNTAVQIKQEVANQSNMNMGKVIADAYINSGLTCLSCNYPPNADSYDKLLLKYTQAKINLSNAIRRYEKRLALEECENVVICLQRQMYSIEPCSRCKKRFNPTARLKNGLKNFPRARSICDE